MSAYKTVPEWVGRPHAFQKITPGLLQKKVDEYFANTDKNPLIIQDFIRSGELAGQIVNLEKQRPYTVEGLCIHLGIHVSTFYEWLSPEKDPQYSEIIIHAGYKIKNQHLELGIGNLYNGNLVARLHKISEQVDHTSNGNELKQITGIIFEQKPDNNE